MRSVAATPIVAAIVAIVMWSTPPGLPPPIAVFGFALITASKSLIVFNFELVGTAITSASRKNIANGFAFVTSKVDFPVANPPGIA